MHTEVFGMGLSLRLGNSLKPLSQRQSDVCLLCLQLCFTSHLWGHHRGIHSSGGFNIANSTMCVQSMGKLAWQNDKKRL